MQPQSMIRKMRRVRGDATRSQTAKAKSSQMRTRIVIEVGPHNARFDSDMMAAKAIRTINQALDYEGAVQSAHATRVKRWEA